VTTLRQLVDDAASSDAIARHLDALDHDGRVAQVQQLGRDAQRRLYERSSPTAPLALDAFVEQPLVVVPHHGWNTLPLPKVGKRFVKQMTRQRDGRVAGYNDAPLAWLVGPGYFTLRQTVGRERVHGPVVVDYYRVPGGHVPPEWPRRRPNWLGPQALIYGWCHDYLRKVSEHVTIGSAYKWGWSAGSWFVLVRPPTA
jgi:hypothetical protein